MKVVHQMVVAMKRILFAALFALASAGCQKPTEVQLVNDQPVLDVEVVDEPDTTIDRAAVDTTALLPRDQQKYNGFVMLSAIKSDWGDGIRSIVLAKVVVENRNQPIIFNRRKIFYGLPLGTVNVNGDVMVPRIRRIGNLSAGFEYLREISNHAPRKMYRFVLDSLNATSFAIQAPENLTVQVPLGGARVARNRNLDLRWTGQGDLFMIISALRASIAGEMQSVPLLRVHAKKNTGSAVLRKEFLSQLPPGAYTLTFVLANREELNTAGRLPAKVLVQASSIYNVVICLL